MAAAKRGDQFGVGGGGVNHQIGFDRQAEGLPDALGQYFVHRQRAGKHAGTGVGDALPVEYRLHLAVFAAASVQDDEGTRKALPFQVKECLMVAGIE